MVLLSAVRSAHVRLVPSLQKTSCAPGYCGNHPISRSWSVSGRPSLRYESNLPVMPFGSPIPSWSLSANERTRTRVGRPYFDFARGGGAMGNRVRCLVAAVALMAMLPSTAFAQPRKHEGKGHAVQLGPRPFFLVDDMDEGPLKDALQECSAGPFFQTDFSIGHRGAALQFPEHTEQSLQGGRPGRSRDPGVRCRCHPGR